MHFLRFIASLLVVWSLASVGLAQTTKPDVLVKTDNSQILGRVIAIDPSEIRYRKLKETTVRRITKTQIWKIIYASGVVRIITPPTKSDIPVYNPQPSSPSTSPVADANNQVVQSPDQQAELDNVIQDLEKDVSVQGRKIRLRPIFFDTGSNRVLPQSFAYLDSIARFLAKIPTVTVEIGGYTDNTGSVSTNNQLSQQRAEAVRNYLVNQRKIAASRIVARGYGQQEPVAKNTTDLGKALNRRVELKFLESAKGEYGVRLKDGQRIQAAFIVVSADGKTIRYRQRPNTPLVRIVVTDVHYIEYPDGSRRNPDGTLWQADRASVPPKTKTFTIQLNGLPAYMLGSDLWKALPDGYGHTIGVGGSLQFDYWLTNRISAGAELGYGVWNTKINVVNSAGEQPYATYYTKAERYGILVHLRLGLGNHFYLMPQGGVNQLAVSIYNDINKISFSGMQTNYGGTLGYLIPMGHTLNADIGLFYQTAIGSSALKTTYGVDPMQYAGVRLGIGFSH